jgi:hypothetical protein
MGGRRPGPTCGTTSEAIDAGTNCRYKSHSPGVVGVGAASEAAQAPLKFRDLWSAYPSAKPYLDPKTGDAPKGYENQCAIKVSVALRGGGVDMSSFRGAHVLLERKKAAIRAKELAEWLKAQRTSGLPSAPQSIVGADWQDKIKGKTGIVYFADYWLRPGEKAPSGDHIDLWNGSRLTASGLEGALVTMARFGLGINAGPGFSDLGQSRTILFWEIK